MRIATLTALLLVTEAPVMAQEADRTPQQDNGSDTSVSLLAGADYISGEIDDQDYETYAASAGLAVRSGRFSLTASVPYVSTTTPEDLIVGNGGVLGLPLLARPTTERREVTRDGIGDVVVQAGYSAPIGSVNAFIAGNVKVPIASREKALGTGEFDYGVTGQVSRQFGRAIGSFQAVQHRLAQCHQIACAMRMLALYAAWSGEAVAADIAATYAQDHVGKLAFDLHQFNGGMGVTAEHKLHFFTYRLRALQAELGGADAAAGAVYDALWDRAA